MNKFKKYDSERKTIRKNFRCTESRKKQIDDSDYTIDEMLDFFFLFSEDEQFEKLMKLRDLKFEYEMKQKELSDTKLIVEKLEDEVLSLEIKIERIQNELDDSNYNLKDYTKSKKVKNSIQTTLKYFKDYYNPTNNPQLTIETFIQTKKTRTYVKNQATRCGVDFDEYVNLLVDAYNESEVQQVLI